MQWQLTQPIESALSNFNKQDHDSGISDKPAGYLLQFNSRTEVLKAYPIVKSCCKYIIGRAEMCAIVIDHVSVSNEHAEIEVEDGILWVVDKHSTNFTRVGDKLHSANTQNKSCKPGRAHQVNSKQFLTLGDVQLRYYHAADYEALDTSVFKWPTTVERSSDVKNAKKKKMSGEDKDLSGAGKEAVGGGLTSTQGLEELRSFACTEEQRAHKIATKEAHVFDPGMSQAFKLSLDMIDDPSSLANARQDGIGSSNPAGPLQDGVESEFSPKPCNTSNKVKSSTKWEMEGKTVQMEGIPESNPEFGERVMAEEKSTSLLPHKRQCLVQAETVNEGTTCDEEEEVEPFWTWNDKALEEVIQAKLFLEPRVTVADKDFDATDKAPCREANVKDDRGEDWPADKRWLIAKSDSAVQSTLRKVQEKVEAKIKHKAQGDKRCTSALLEGESKFVEIVQLEGAKNVPLLSASQCSVLVSQPSQLQTVTSQRDILPKKLDFSSQGKKTFILDRESWRSVTKKNAQEGKEHEPLVRCKRKPDTDPMDSLFRSKCRKFPDREMRNLNISDNREKKNIFCMEKYDSPEFWVKAENKKKRKQSLSIEALTFPTKKARISTLSEPLSSSALRCSAGRAAKKSIYLLRTGYTNSKENKQLRKIGAIILNSVVPKLTHLFIDKFRTTEKVLCGLAYCDYLVSDLWPTACSIREHFNIDEAEYFIKPDKKLQKTEKELGFKLTEVIRRRNRRITKVFNGLKLLKTQDVNPVFGNMFVAHGGKLAKSAGRRPCPQLIILGLDEEDQQAQTFLSKHYKVRSPSSVKASIFRQELPMESEFLINRRP